MDLGKTCRASKYAIGVALSILLFVSGAEATNLIDSCTTISEPGEYVLDRSIMNSSSSSCINITSSNVFFNGSGNTIDGVYAWFTNTYGVYVYSPTKTLTNVTIKNLNVTEWYYGIYYRNATEGIIENNNANSNSYNGIYLSSSSDIFLTSNYASSNRYYGIELLSSNNNTLYNNQARLNGGYGYDISSSGYGIYLLSSNNNTLKNNYVSSNGNGLGLESFSSNNTLTNNNANSNEIIGIGLVGSGGNNNLTNNSMNNNSNNFVALESLDGYSDSSIEISNTIDGKPIFYIKNVVDAIYDSSTNAGTFYCIRCNNVTIRDLNVTKNVFGISIILTNNSKIENISASSNVFGIGLYGFNNNNTITNNKASANNYGIFLGYYNNNNTLINNNVSTNHDGIILGDYNYFNTITYNNASSNVNGISLSTGNRNNSIINNYVSSNRVRGIFFYEDNYDNRIYHNNLINNTNQASGATAANLWDSGHPGGGNYWSDYNGTDVNNDGIGDTPYNISGGWMVKDRYPFMRMNGWMPQQTVTVTPGFEILWVIFSVVIVFFLKRIRL